MDSVLDVLSLLFFPGIVFALVLGLLSTWTVQSLNGAFRGEPAPAWGEIFGATSALARLALTQLRREVQWAIGLLLVGLGAAGAASTALWRAAILGQGWSIDLVGLIGFLGLPLLLAAVFSDWSARRSGASAGRDALALVYVLILVLTLCVPAIQARSVDVAEILGYQASAGPLVGSWPGGLAFFVGLLSTRATLSLFSGMWDEGVAEAQDAATALVLQFVRAAWLSSVVAVLVFLFLGFPGGTLEALLFWPKYLLVLSLLVGAQMIASRLSVERTLAAAWLPLLLGAGLALGLAAGGA